MPVEVLLESHAEGVDALAHTCKRGNTARVTFPKFCSFGQEGSWTSMDDEKRVHAEHSLAAERRASQSIHETEIRCADSPCGMGPRGP